MNIFGIGGAELVLIILIMLVVAGPQRMIRWAYHMGRYVGMLRTMWAQMMEMVQKEVDAAGYDIKVPRDLPTRDNVSKLIRDAAKPLSDPLEKTMREVTQPVKDTLQEVKQAGADVNRSVAQAGKALDAEMKDVGSWNGASTPADSTPAATSAEKPTPDADASGFGAWTTPQHPSQQANQEQGS